jgi:hypothetical protein
MIAAAAAGSSPIGAGVGGPVPDAVVVSDVELDCGEVQAAKPTTTASNGSTPRFRLLVLFENGALAWFAQ